MCRDVMKMMYLLTYNIKHQCCTTTFYVQRCNEDDVPLDL